MSNLKKPTCASKQHVLELATLREINWIISSRCPMQHNFFATNQQSCELELELAQFLLMLFHVGQ